VATPEILLYATCYLDGSGVSELNLQILTACREKGIEVHVLTTETLPAEGVDRSSAFDQIATSIAPTGQMSESVKFSEFVALLRSQRIGLLFICHSTWTYRNLRKIPEAFPRLVIVDALHTLEPYRLAGGFPDLSGCGYVNSSLDRSIVISTQMKGYLERYYRVPSSKIHVVPNGVNVSRLRHLPRRKIGPDRATVGFVGRLVRQKDPLLFVDVARLMLKTNRDLKFSVVGQGPLRSAMERRVRRYGIGGQFRWQEHWELPEDIYPSLDLLLLTSKYEGVPLAALEAIVSGLPVVATDVGAIREQCGEFLRLVAPGPRVARRLGRAALEALSEQPPAPHQRSLEQFDIENTLAGYLAVFSL
jgi:glycosyltransferase involved in cell wall biosynthesis